MTRNNNLGRINIGNNWGKFPFPPFEFKADLIISDSEIIWEKNRQSVHFKIKNRGLVDSSGFYIKLYAKSEYKSKILLKRFYIPQLKKDKTIEREFDITSNNEKLKNIDTIIIEVDTYHQVKESNERNNIEIIDIPMKELIHDNTRQVRTRRVDNSEKIELLADGIPYQFNCKSGNYVGCGIDAGHSFMGWLDDTISRAKIKQHIETTNLTPDIISSGDTFTSPAQMSNGIKSLVNISEYRVVRYHKNNDNYVLNKIKYHLSNGMPVIALIKNGNHWVTIVGMECIYDSKDNISLNSNITYIDLTNAYTYTKSYSDLKICHWSNSFAHTLYSSYEAGTIISIDNVTLQNSYDKKAYKIEIYTGTIKGAGTDSHVLLKLISSNDNRYTYNMDTICNDNEKGSRTIKSFIVDEYLENIDSIEIIKDNAGRYSDWYVNYIKIIETTTSREFVVPINSWISPINENIYPVGNNLTRYNILVNTGDVAYAGTDAKVYIKLYGTRGRSSFIRLDNKSNNFEKNDKDYFSILHEDIGDITKIKVKHNNSGDKAGWFLEKILIKNLSKTYNFTAKQWISANKGSIPEIILIEDSKKIKYNVVIKTSNTKNAGTDAGVYIQLFGTNNKHTPLQRIDNPKYDDFEKNSIGKYIVYADEDLGEIKKIRLEHDNTGDGPWWKIDTVVVNNLYKFNIYNWLGATNKRIHPSKIFTR